MGPESSPETSIEEKLLIENKDMLPSAENRSSIVETETRLSGSCLLKLDISQRVPYTQQRIRRGGRKGFSIWHQTLTYRDSHINVKEREKCDLLTECHGLKIILEEEKDRISEINDEEENK